MQLTNPVQVGLLCVRHIKIDNVVDFIDVDTSPHQVGGHQEPEVPLTEVVVGLLAEPLVVL